MRRTFQIALAALVVFLCVSVYARRARTQGQSQAQERRYYLNGSVISIDKTQKQLVVAHGEIPGFMAAMTMPYLVASAQSLDGLISGDQITADVVVTGEGVHLENIVVTKKSNGASPAGQAAPELHDATMPLPKDYRKWVFLSSGLGMTYDPNGVAAANPLFDNVFVNPEAYEWYVKNGTWPDKTVMVLELRASTSELSINKNGRVQTDVTGVETHVKDVAHGGWAFYSFGRGAQQGTLLPKSATCYSCHEQNAAVDTTFVQFYPTLIEIAKNKGTFKTNAP
jgi:Cu/Ag efflux protein CusF